MAGETCSGAEFLGWIKRTAGDGRVGAAIPVGRPLAGMLRPVATNADRLADRDVAYLTEWRNLHVKRFLTEFDATDERTRHWLINTIGPDKGKILFMVDLPSGETIGHIGLGFIDWATGYGEADAIVRGKEAPAGLMKQALQTALAWAQDQLELKQLGVRVRSDNPAVEFYRKVGFVEIKRVPLDVERSPGMTRWFESPGLTGPAANLVYMVYQPGP